MDIYGVISRNDRDIQLVIPNSLQYAPAHYTEQEIKRDTYKVVVRTKSKREVFHANNGAVIAVIGDVRIKNKVVSPKELLERYVREKSTVFSETEGLFNALIVEKQPFKVTVVNDHFGLIPVFYYSNNDRLVVSTKLDFVQRNSAAQRENLNYSALLEQVYFNYTIGDKTYFNDIYMQNAASILEFTFDDSTVKKKEKVYWHISECINKPKIPYKQALTMYSELYYEIVHSAAEKSLAPVLALTAGYDTRTNLAALLNNASNIPCFSYGMRDSVDVDIPLQLQRKFGLDYKPIYLEGIFERDFINIAENAIFHSDGLGDLEKANNEYAYSLLSAKHTDVIVGLFGSEFLKSYHFPNRLMPLTILRIFYDADTEKDDFPDDDLNSDLKHELLQGLQKYVEEEYIEKYHYLSNIQKLLLFFYYECTRKYFMKELRIGRYYVDFMIPYINKNLLEILLRSDLSAVNYPSSRVKAFMRKQKAHFVYSHLIKERMPSLLEVETSSGYKPKYDLSFFSRPLIFPYYLRRKVAKQKPQYNYNVWAQPFINKHINLLKGNEVLGRLIPKNKIGIEVNDAEHLHRLISIALYLDRIST